MRVFGLLGRKSDQKAEILQNDHTTFASEKFLQRRADAWSTTPDDLSFLMIDDPESLDFQKLDRGDRAPVLWQNGEVVGLDWTVDDGNLLGMKIEVQGKQAGPHGYVALRTGEFVRFRFRLFHLLSGEADAPATDINGLEVDVPVAVGEPRAFLHCTFTNGLSENFEVQHSGDSADPGVDVPLSAPAGFRFFGRALRIRHSLTPAEFNPVP